jgi:Cys-tRNA(Pro)/Cys-tRNA(Cys) deacylase
MKEIQSLTGYIRGGCSPLGTKKTYPVYLDSSALTLQQIAVSAGTRGEQLLLAPADLIAAVNAKTARLTK